MKKQCSSCRKEKPLNSFKNTAKTTDGKYPYCKECEFKYRVRSQHHRHQISNRLYREIVDCIIPYQPAGRTHLFFNKDIFTKWLFMHPDFEKLYRKYLKHIGELEFHIKPIVEYHQLTVDNLKIYLNTDVVKLHPLFDPNITDGE